MTFRILRLAERISPLPGGKQIHVLELTRAQTRLGHRVHVLYRFGDGESIGSSTEINVPRTLEQLSGLGGTASFAAQAMRTARSPSPVDIVHAHGDLAVACMCSRRPRGSPTPTVVTIHSQLRPNFRHPSRFLLAGIDAFIALGDRVRQDLDRCGVPDDRIVTMSSGLNRTLLDEARRTVTPMPGSIVAVGTLDRVKNLDTLIRAVNGNAISMGDGVTSKHERILPAPKTSSGDAR
jgi:glycosyltransferase involved in cell wall biosynthesis